MIVSLKMPGIAMVFLVQGLTIFTLSIICVNLLTVIRSMSTIHSICSKRPTRRNTRMKRKRSIVKTSSDRIWGAVQNNHLKCEYLLRLYFFLRYIHSKNRAGLTFRLAPNHLADHTSDELVYMRGKLRSKGFNGGKPFHFKNEEVENLPDQMDWRLYGAVTSVKGLC